MLDRSRVTLFVFMLCLVILNPFQLIMNGESEQASASVSFVASIPGGRTLQAAFDPQGVQLNCNSTLPCARENGFVVAENESWWQDRLFRLTCLWLLNGIVISCVLARLLIYGEPVTDADSQSSAQFRRHKTQAEMDIDKVSDRRQATRCDGQPPAAAFAAARCSLIAGTGVGGRARAVRVSARAGPCAAAEPSRRMGGAALAVG